MAPLKEVIISPPDLRRDASFSSFAKGYGNLKSMGLIRLPQPIPSGPLQNGVPQVNLQQPQSLPLDCWLAFQRVQIIVKGYIHIWHTVLLLFIDEPVEVKLLLFFKFHIVT